MEENNANNNAGNSNQNAQNTTGQTDNSGVVDFNKIQAIIDSRNEKIEASVLKNYFEKQGLSQEDAQKAIEKFKETKAQEVAAKANDTLNLQNENQSLKAQVQRMSIEKEANQCALELGIDAKKIPFVIKMVDLNDVMKNGEISKEAITNALNAVLEIMPELKPQAQENKGFQKIGAENNNNNNSSTDEILKNIFGG